MTLIYLTLDSRNFDFSIADLTKCLISVQEWMKGLILKLNHDKTEFIIIDNKHTRQSLLPKFPVTFLQSSVTLADEVKT